MAAGVCGQEQWFYNATDCRAITDQLYKLPGLAVLSSEKWEYMMVPFLTWLAVWPLLFFTPLYLVYICKSCADLEEDTV